MESRFTSTILIFLSSTKVLHIVWKLLKMSHLNLARIFVLSGNTVWPQTSGFQKVVKIDYFWHFPWTFGQSKCKRSSLRSQCWIRLFMWFSNTVYLPTNKGGYKTRKFEVFLSMLIQRPHIPLGGRAWVYWG